MLLDINDIESTLDAATSSSLLELLIESLSCCICGFCANDNDLIGTTGTLLPADELTGTFGGAFLGTIFSFWGLDSVVGTCVDLLLFVLQLTRGVLILGGGRVTLFPNRE